MLKRNLLKGKCQVVLFGLIAVLIVIADQLTKDWIKAHVDIGERSFDPAFSISPMSRTAAPFWFFQGNSPLFAVAATITAII